MLSPALPIDSAVNDGEAVVMRPDNSSGFRGAAIRHGQAQAIFGGL